MTEPAWEEIRQERYEDYWTPFDERFQFWADMQPERWPAIREPSPSVTFDLSSVSGGGQADFGAGQKAINALALVAMVRTVAATERLLVLDWQHPSYWFLPHRQAVSDDGQWPVEVFPNGDYYIFLTEDMTAGTFGHPWEETLCVFGERFVSTLAPMLASWLPVKRPKP
jgi:hypothetical protein